MGTIKKFLADPSLGRLSKWLRILGFDTVYFSNPFDEKIFFEKAKSENRMILTRSEKIISRLNKEIPRQAQGDTLGLDKEDYFFITCNHIDEQLKELINKEIISRSAKFFFAGAVAPFGCGNLPRCVECNNILSKIDRESLHGKIPDYIRETQESFRQCPNCKKIFWAGTHCKRMKEKIDRLYG